MTTQSATIAPEKDTARPGQPRGKHRLESHGPRIPRRFPNPLNDTHRRCRIRRSAPARLRPLVFSLHPLQQRNCILTVIARGLAKLRQHLPLFLFAHGLSVPCPIPLQCLTNRSPAIFRPPIRPRFRYDRKWQDDTPFGKILDVSIRTFATQARRMLGWWFRLRDRSVCPAGLYRNLHG